MAFPPESELNKFAVNNSSYPAIPFTVEFRGRDPTFTDVNFPIQKIWLNKSTNTFWFLRNFYLMPTSFFAANWIKMGGSSIVETVQGNTGPVVPPNSSNNIFVLGDGTYLTTAGNAGTNTLTISPAGGLATLYTENTGTASAMAGNLNVLGAGPITTSGSGNTISINTNGTIATSYVEDSGAAVPSGGVLNVLGGTGITTAGSGNTITINATGSVPLTFDEDTGSATPAANVINVHGGTGISTSGSGNTITITATGIDTAPNYTNVTHAMSPYTVNVTTPPLDYYISVDCSGGVVHLNFPNAPTFKQLWIIKDRTGNGAVSNITLTTPGGTVTFDGLTTYTMNSNYQAINLLANASDNYEVY